MGKMRTTSSPILQAIPRELGKNDARDITNSEAIEKKYGFSREAVEEQIGLLHDHGWIDYIEDAIFVEEITT